MKQEKLFVCDNIVLEDSILDGGILVGTDGKIKKVLKKDELNKWKNQSEVIDVSGLHLMPGIIDSHVHINEPGRTEWEGFESATKAAAAGGVTTIIDMPLNSIPPTTTLENLDAKIEAAKNQVHVDVGFWGGVVPGNQGELLKMIEAGVVGFKCFMCPSGVDEFSCVNLKDVEEAMQILEGTDVVFAFHAEMDSKPLRSDGLNFYPTFGKSAPPKIQGDPNQYKTFLETRPGSMEVEAIKNILEIAGNYRTKIHIVHLSTAEALASIQEAKGKGINLTVETCHHYLNISSEDVPDGATQFKCCPPVRDAQNKECLWNALENGTIDMVVSDHSPSTPDLKCLREGDPDFGNFLKAWGGIASLQFGLSLLWTAAAKRNLTIYALNKYMTRATAKLVGLHTSKGQIQEGFDADFAIWDPKAVFLVEESSIYHKNKLTPYMGRELLGVVHKTVLRGEIVYENGKFGEPMGKLLLR